MTQEFKDHIVQYPNRFKRVPVAGKTDEFDMIPTWMENPSEVVQVGTPIDRQLFEGISAQLAEIAINVQNFGAVGDGVTDDSVAFASAIAFAKTSKIRRIYAPKSYLINSTIDLTNLQTNGITIDGAQLSFAHGQGSEIILNTGGVGIDCTGSSRMNFRNLKITSRRPEQTNPSKIGILIARSEFHKYADRCNFVNCLVETVSDYTANGGVGTIGVYNYAGEIFNIDNSEIRGDIPIVFTQTNLYNVQSSITSIRLPDVLNTMTTVRVSGTVLTSWRSYACVAQNLGEAYFKVNTDCYPPASSGLVKGIADFRFEGDFNKNIHIDEIHSEVFNKFIELNGNLDFFNFTGLKSAVTDRVIDMLTSTSRLRSGKINLQISVDRTNFPTGKTALIYNPFTNDFNLNSIEMNLGSASKIEAPNQRLTSSKVISTETVSNTEINVRTNSRYELLAYDGSPVCQVRSAVTQSLPSGSSTYLTFDTIDENAGTMFSVGAPDRLTITKAGLYMVQLSVTLNTMTGESRFNIFKSGVIHAAESKSSSSAHAPRYTLSTLIRCEVGDTIQAQGFQNSGLAVSTFIEGRNSAVLRIARIAP